MLKISSILFCFLSVLYFSQQQRIFYNYSKKSVDSNDKVTYHKETFILDIGKKMSRYMSYEAYESDSIKKVESKTAAPEFFSQSWFKGSRFFIDKTYPDYAVNQISSLTSNVYNIVESRKITWEILPETSKINNFTVQKATTNFLGRKWNAWFSTEIPIQDGPFKFYGLPGLILKVSDSEDIYTYEFAGIKVRPEINFETTPFWEDSSKFIKVSFEKYKKVYKDYLNGDDIRAIMNTNPPAGDTEEFVNLQGQNVSKVEFYKPMLEARLRNMNKNVPLDLELLKSN